MYLRTYKTSSGTDVIVAYTLSLDDVYEQAIILELMKSIDSKGAKYLIQKDKVNTRKLADGLFEIKILKNRFAYMYLKNNYVYMLHAFRKEKQKTEKNDLELAKKRLKEIKCLLSKR